MKNICIVDFNMTVRGGVEQVAANLANAFADYYHVHVLSLCGDGTSVYALDERARFHTILPQEKRLRQMKAELKEPVTAYFKENRIDAALLMGNYTGYLISGLQPKTKTKLIFCDHGSLINQWEQKDIVFIRAYSCLFSKRIVTLTERNMQDYRRKFHIPRKKIQYIYNWIDPACACSAGYAADSKRIVSAGRFGKEKGFDQLIKAFAPVAKKYPDWKLEIFGDGEMMPVVKQLIEEYGIKDNVVLMGMRKDLAQRYRDYAMYVLPSYREGLPLVLLEAKANRLPIVSFDILTGPREIVRDGIDGILVPERNIEALGNAMETLIQDRELRKKMSERSQENLELFSKEKIINQWRQLIDSLG